MKTSRVIVAVGAFILIALTAVVGLGARGQSGRPSQDVESVRSIARAEGLLPCR
jgi:hypothetical protein